ncbi:MAG: adenine C2-methylase RlmN of 23S rRNA A2503 and tRNA A37, partial [Glaciecola sp.]
MIMDPIDPYSLDPDGLTELVEQLGEPKYRAKQVRDWLVKGVDDP